MGRRGRRPLLLTFQISAGPEKTLYPFPLGVECPARACFQSLPVSPGRRTLTLRCFVQPSCSVAARATHGPLSLMVASVTHFVNHEPRWAHGLFLKSQILEKQNLASEEGDEKLIT